MYSYATPILKQDVGLGPWIDHLNPFHEDTIKYKSYFETFKSILGITQIINKGYQVIITKFNQNILLYTLSLSDLFT